jgi:hypothetical protein
MSAKNSYPVKSISSPKIQELDFRFYPNFTSAVSTIQPSRGVTSIARVAAGTWDVTLDDRYYALTGASLKMVTAHSDAGFRLTNASDVISGYTGSVTVVRVVHEIAGTATDIVAAATNYVLTKLTFTDSAEGM